MPAQPGPALRRRQHCFPTAGRSNHQRRFARRESQNVRQRIIVGPAGLGKKSLYSRTMMAAANASLIHERRRGEQAVAIESER